MVITFINIKGGVGKTTSIVNISASLASLGKKVLILDADPNSSATKYLAMDQEVAESGKSMMALLEKELPDIKSMILKTEYKNLDIVGCTDDFERFRREADLLTFSDFIDPVLSEYDYIMIDTHGTIDNIMFNALNASDFYMLPLFAEADSFDGFVYMVKQANRVKKKMNRKLENLGVLICNYRPKSATHKAFRQTIVDACEQIGFNYCGEVPFGEMVSASSADRMPLIHYRETQRSPAREKYLQLAKLLVDDKIKEPDILVQNSSDNANMTPNGGI